MIKGDSMSVSTPLQDEAQQQLTAGDVPAYMQALGKAARSAASELRRADTGIKNRALESIAQQLMTARARILDANAQDMQRGKENGLDSALLDRWRLITPVLMR